MLKVKSFMPAEGEIAKYRKEDGFARETVAIDAKSGAAILTVREYNTASRTYVCIWLHGWLIGAPSAHGGAFAGGYGYHRASAAAEKAFEAAGFRFNEHFGGRGDSAVRDAILAVLAHVAPKCEFYMHVAHP